MTNISLLFSAQNPAREAYNGHSGVRSAPPKECTLPSPPRQIPGYPYAMAMRRSCVVIYNNANSLLSIRERNVASRTGMGHIRCGCRQGNAGVVSDYWIKMDEPVRNTLDNSTAVLESGHSDAEAFNSTVPLPTTHGTHPG